jgi:hypothetical protein
MDKKAGWNSIRHFSPLIISLDSKKADKLLLRDEEKSFVFRTG